MYEGRNNPVAVVTDCVFKDRSLVTGTISDNSQQYGRMKASDIHLISYVTDKKDFQ
jgi:precorrin-4 methylase